MGDIGVSNLYGQYDDYQSFGLDVGYRRYVPLKRAIKAYAEGTVGLAFVDETDVASWRRGRIWPATRPTSTTGPRRSRSAATRGCSSRLASQFDVFAQVGLRYVTGMSEVDGLVGTGLENINDKSSRWTVPFIVGVRLRF